MSTLYKLPWAVADSRVLHSTFIYQVTEGVTWKEGTKACFRQGLCISGADIWSDREGLRTPGAEERRSSRDKTGQGRRKRTSCRATKGLGALPERMPGGRWNKEWAGPVRMGRASHTDSTAGNLSMRGCVNTATRAVHGMMRQDAG